MNSPVRDMRQEAAALHKIALFNPRFREVYGLMAVFVILVLALAILTAGIRWLAPWNGGYTPEERRNIWFGVIVMPVAGVLAASYLVEFILKSVHVGWWAASGGLKLARQSKILGWVAGPLLAIGCVMSVLGGDLDLWGYHALIAGIFVAYWFVVFAWEATDEARRPNKSPQTTRAFGPRV